MLLGSTHSLLAAIPAAPVMTLYKFNGPVRVPYYQIGASGPGAIAGYLTQGSSVIPCLVVRNGQALTDNQGTPYVGFEVLVNSATAGPEATKTFKQALARQASLNVDNHHCKPDVRHVLNVRELYQLTKAPFFDPPRTGQPPVNASGDSNKGTADSTLDRLIREFHNSQDCASVDSSLLGRRARLARAWDDFIARKRATEDANQLARAKHLDYSMRTALYEGHLDRGCNAYGACERNVVVLSIRNRAIGQCSKGRGCRFPGDFQGVSSDPSQYNIWDNFLTQISGLTSCYLRSDLADKEYYQHIQRMYQQNVGDAEQILYGGEPGLEQVFPGTSMSDLTELRHYYHPPAMRKCFPQQERIEYMSGAVAEKDGQFALIANTRIKVGQRVGKGYRFKEFRFEHTDAGDQLQVLDNYPGFIVDGRKVSLKSGHSCTPYGVSRSCKFNRVNRYRTVPSWLSAGKPLTINCRVQSRGANCSAAPSEERVSVGGDCDTEMMPVTRVP
ncbi:hypothetical protein CKO36_04870 [Rhabdochromatium marinum]|nr:hypothetical protein [Rhabdochromatium marinum]